MTARAGQDRCICGEPHSGDDSVTAATVARVKAYLAANPDNQVVVDDETGIIAVIITPRPGTSGPLRILAQSSDLTDLLNTVGASSRPVS